MAELARGYHESLQEKEKNVTPGEREAAIRAAIGRIDATLSHEQSDKLGAQITELEVTEALRLSKNNAAAGLDGLPYELWKALFERYKEDVESDRPAFDVVNLLTQAFQDVQRYGVAPGINFAEGLMSPIYKQKGERADIASYRPITLLNTDYKLFTKILAMRLSGAAAELIHEDQAGFMKGRSIADQTKQLRMIIDYAEAVEENGLIVALDQEKAYDKVAHDYLWRVLQKFGLPDSFISVVKSLYQGATTQVAINGHISSKFEVYRGVRQGDPLSCLIFDLAIEPLAIALRKSNLRGLEMSHNGDVHTFLATLFADDTTVVLSEHDSFQDLEKILDEWSIAAKAAFNVQKTEIIPIGSPTFRSRIINQRAAGNLEIPASISIAREGEPKRILGAWFGNNLNAEEIWSRTLDRVEDDFQRWDRSKPSMIGRCHIVQMVAAGRTQYLTEVQGMPPPVEKRLVKRILKFMWKDSTQRPVALETMCKPISEGGLGLVDIPRRNRAIAIKWLQRYLNYERRPKWAILCDAIAARRQLQRERGISNIVKRNLFLQSWNTNQGYGDPLSRDLRELLKTAKRYCLQLDQLIVLPETAREMPIWYHIEAQSRIRRLTSSRASICLRDVHKIRTVGDAENLIQELAAEEIEPGCMHPEECANKAQELLSTLPAKWDPRNFPHGLLSNGDAGEQEPDDEDELVMFSPPYKRESSSIAHAFRIFTHGNKAGGVPQLAPPQVRPLVNPTSVVVHGQAASFDPTLNEHNAGLAFICEAPGGMQRKITRAHRITDLAATAIALTHMLASNVIDRTRPW